MKRLIIGLFIIVATSYMLSGQNSAVDKIFDKYSGKEGYTSVFISKYMFNLFSQVNPDDKDLNQIVNGLSSIKILATEDSMKNVNFYNEIMKDLPVKDYKELMVIKEKDQDLKFLIRDKEGVIVELLMIVGGTDNAIICIQGDNINLKNISNLSKSMKIDGLENLEKMNEKEKK